jgi:hypothetical protein
VEILNVVIEVAFHFFANLAQLSAGVRICIDITGPLVLPYRLFGTFLITKWTFHLETLELLFEISGANQRYTLIILINPYESLSIKETV